MANDLILGTAGHIDHGKTSLIAALTGINTDRLPEEKRRGITIELGYAHLDLPPYHIGIVDVPGHEKFVRQMLAGATGIDMALLVIAANDSVKQQTREHLDILRILDLPVGVVAITKSDLVEPDWLGLVREEIAEAVAGTFLSDAPMVATSIKTGAGLDELKETIKEVANKALASHRRLSIHAPFKMAIDRAFTIEGHGTIVTGSVNSGTARVGDALEIQPGNKRVRVRSVQNHDQAAEFVARGQRAAINLSGVGLEEVQRGHEVCSPGHLVASQLVTAELFVLPSAAQPLKNRKRVRFHIGTAEVMASIRLLDQEDLSPGESGLAQIYLNEPIVAIWNQPFVIRRESPVFTIGGGRILDPNAEKIRDPNGVDFEMLRQLARADELERSAAAAYWHCSDGWDPYTLPRTVGVFAIESTLQPLLDSGEVIKLRLSASRDFLVHRLRLQQFSERVLAVLEKLHMEFPLRFTHVKSDLEARFAWLENKVLLQAAIRHLKDENKIVLNENSIGLVGAGPKISKGEQQLMDHLTKTILEAGLQPPTVQELQKSITKNKDSLEEVLRLAGENGVLVQVSREFHFHRSVIDEVCRRLKSEIFKTGGLTVSEIRQLLNISRKYAIPLCEYLDSINFLSRDGDTRRLGESAL